MIRIIYSIFFYLMLPAILLRLLWKSYKYSAYKKRWHERLAYYKDAPLKNSIWLHAVSVGEFIAAIPLLKALKNSYPDTTIVVTTMTPTGSERVTQTFGNDVYHIYLPYDYPGAVKRLLRHINPRLLIIMETELWPNTLHYCNKQKIATILANARLSQHSAKGYARLAALTRNMLDKIQIIAAQSQLDAQRFINLGADVNKVKVVGNIKFDITLPDNLMDDSKQLRAKFGIKRPILIAASTHAGEEEQILIAHQKIKQQLKDALLILVPRHPERFDYAANLCKKYNFNFIRYSRNEKINDKTDIIVGDTMGQLLIFYACADAAFVGGSLVNKGGHNLLEPAALSMPILSGPHLSNFNLISKLLLQHNALTIVNNSEELAEKIIALLVNHELQQQMGTAAYQVVKQNQGALNKTIELIKNLM